MSDVADDRLFDAFFHKRKKATISGDLLWELTDSNRRPAACKAAALNQLS